MDSGQKGSRKIRSYCLSSVGGEGDFVVCWGVFWRLLFCFVFLGKAENMQNTSRKE